jgi:ADP-heptose:LPS heptosyltransferase
LKHYGELPGGDGSLKDLLFPFQSAFPKVLYSKYRWWLNARLSWILPYLNFKGKWLTIIDRLGAPGDALITANVIRCIKSKYQNIRINCITPHPELIEFDPQIDSLNRKETFFSFDSSYWQLIVRKDQNTNIIAHNMQRLGIQEYQYKAKYFISDKEREWGRQKVCNLKKPIIAICTKSKEPVKNWLSENWMELISNIHVMYSIVQLGDSTELKLNGTTRFAGKYTMRQSAAILSHANLFIGPDSLLMHVANGLGIPSIIIFGGSRPIKCLGYPENENIASTPHCSPCWIHQGYESCQHDIKCMSNIETNQITPKIEQIISN